MSQLIRSPRLALKRSTSTPVALAWFHRTAAQPTSTQPAGSSSSHSSVTRVCRTFIVHVPSTSSRVRSKTTMRLSPLASSSHTRLGSAAGRVASSISPANAASPIGSAESGLPPGKAS